MRNQAAAYVKKLSPRTEMSAIAMKKMKNKYTKELFEKLPPEKKEKIIRAAISEFARTGINGCNVRDIAKRIGISHGSLFHYFSSKDDMIHAIIQTGYARQRDILVNDIPDREDFYEHLNQILLSCLAFAGEQKELISIWLEMSLPTHERFSRHTFDLEAEAIRSLKELIEAGKQNGAIRDEIDTEAAAYMVDSILANVLKSRVSKIEKKKLKAHFGDLAKRNEEVAAKIVGMLKTAFAP